VIERGRHYNIVLQKWKGGRKRGRCGAGLGIPRTCKCSCQEKGGGGGGKGERVALSDRHGKREKRRKGGDGARIRETNWLELQRKKVHRLMSDMRERRTVLFFDGRQKKGKKREDLLRRRGEKMGKIFKAAFRRRCTGGRRKESQAVTLPVSAPCKKGKGRIIGGGKKSWIVR